MSGERYKIWPYAAVEMAYGQWSIPDEIMAWVWDELARQDRIRWTFWGGVVTTFEQFLAFMRSPENHPLLLVDMKNGNPCVLAWLNGVVCGHAYLHFSIIGPYWRGMAETVLRYWFGFRNDAGQPLLRLLIGVTPENNEPAIRLNKMVGFAQLEPAIPELCELAYEGGKRVGGIISYRLNGR